MLFQFQFILGFFQAYPSCSKLQERPFLHLNRKTQCRNPRLFDLPPSPRLDSHLFSRELLFRVMTKLFLCFRQDSTDDCQWPEQVSDAISTEPQCCPDGTTSFILLTQNHNNLIAASAKDIYFSRAPPRVLTDHYAHTIVQQ